jgi:uncharacterized protein (TIGR02147 family)
MAFMTVFEFRDYKSYIQQLADQSPLRGYKTKIATAAGCQRAFVSQVLNGKAHFTSDQAIKLCHFWQFRELEIEYFMELVQFAKAGTQELRSYSASRLKELRSRHSELSVKFKSTGKLSEHEQSIYYSSWQYSAIHVLTSIPSFQTERALANRLQIPEVQIARLLSELEAMNLVTKRAGRWKPTERNLFLPRQSHMNHAHHANWRLQALADVQKNSNTSVHYSTLHALSRQDVEVLRTKILDFIQESKTIVEPSPEEEMVCLCIDYFEV